MQALDKGMNILLVIELLAVVLLLSMFAFQIVNDLFAKCDSILNRTAPTNPGAGLLIQVDDIKTCKTIGYPEYQGMLNNLARITGATYGIAISNHPFYLIYDGDIIDPQRVLGGRNEPYMTQMIYGIESIELMRCGDPVPTVGLGTLLIYPCAK